MGYKGNAIALSYLYTLRKVINEIVLETIVQNRYENVKSGSGY